MVVRSNARDESPIYARLSELYAVEDADWAISAPPQFRRELADRHGWSGWFDQNTLRIDTRMTR